MAGSVASLKRHTAERRRLSLLLFTLHLNRQVSWTPRPLPMASCGSTQGCMGAGSRQRSPQAAPRCLQSLGAARCVASSAGATRPRGTRSTAAASGNQPAGPSSSSSSSSGKPSGLGVGVPTQHYFATRQQPTVVGGTGNCGGSCTTRALVLYTKGLEYARCMRGRTSCCLPAQLCPFSALLVWDGPSTPPRFPAPDRAGMSSGT